MAEFLDFLARHWMLSGAFGLVLVLFIINEIKQRGGGAKLNPQQAVELMNHEGATVIDVRHPDAFREAHILNSKNIPSADLEDKMSSLNKYKQKALILIDEQGMQASKAALKLRKEGFEQIFFVSGGMMSWKADNLPLTKKN